MIVRQAQGKPGARQAIDPRRRAMLAKVHVAKKELGLDDTAYGDVLFRETGRASSADCSDAELVKLLDAFKRMGWQAKPPLRQAQGNRFFKSRRPQDGAQGASVVDLALVSGRGREFV